nr:uncharacterized protein LOC112728838 [Arachis hypogaea]
MIGNLGELLRFNSALQLVEDEASLLSGVMRLLRFDYTKFLICEKDRRKVRTRDKVYNEIVKEMFHFKEDSRGIIKRIIFKMLGRAWKETKNRLYHRFYDKELSLEENIENRSDGNTEDHWRWFFNYRHTDETQAICKKNAENRSKQLYTYTDGSKSLASRNDKEGELNDSLAQALGKEHPDRMRGMGLGLTSSQVFGMNSHQSINNFEREETQRVLLELQAKLAAEKLKRKAVDDEVAAEKTKRQVVEDEVAVEKTKRQAVEDEVAAGKVRMQAMESALICLLQGQGRKLPSDVAAWMSALEGQNRK